jgi:signal transduction histidine kinase
VFIGFGRDITDLKRIQSEQIKAEKLESLNLLAAGIAHNFNNILTGVIGYIAFARKHLKNHDKTAPMLEAAEKSSYRAARLARQLLTFSKGGVPFRRLTAVDTLVRESMTMFLGGSNIKGIIDDHATLMINVDCEQIKQVINNIIINAMHSMPNGGELAVNLTDLQVDAGNVFLLKPGKHVKIDFEDNGCGIKKEHLDKVFDPYFTTHADGSGLGLSLAHSIIAKHDGEISVSSEADRGTTVTIMLPGFQTVPEENTLEKEEMLRNAVGVTLQLHGK